MSKKRTKRTRRINKRTRRTKRKTNIKKKHLSKDKSSKQICIVSNNCYGTKYYHKNKLQYNSPFIGIFLYSECYIKLLENFSKYMKKKPKP